MQRYVSLNQNKDFLRLYYRGKSCAKPSVVVYAAKNRAGVCRIGITTSKKIGNAVERNRSRRIIKAAWQNVFRDNQIKGNWDFVFVARNKTKFQKSTVVANAIADSLKELGIIDEKRSD
ncbi:MAG: ribonuclease P protein component [Clostridia bacterium]|nr:ribonuclease P protein component [Clostridia bacterium]